MQGKVTTFGLSALFILLWSSGWIGSKFGLYHSGLFTLLSLRYLVLTALLALFLSVCAKWRKMTRYEVTQHMLIGILCHAIYLCACLLPIDMGVSAGMVAFVAALQPMFTALASSFLTGERVGMVQWQGITFGIISVAAVVSDKISLGGSLLAYLLLIYSVVAICLGTLLDKRLTLQNQLQNKSPTPLLQVLFIHAASSCLFLLPLAYMADGFEFRVSRELLFAVGWSAIAVSLGGYGLLFLLLRQLSTYQVSSLIYLTPPTTMIIGYIAFNETLTPIDGCGLVLAGFAVCLVSRPNASKIAEPPQIFPDIDVGDPLFLKSTRTNYPF